MLGLGWRVGGGVVMFLDEKKNYFLFSVVLDSRKFVLHSCKFTFATLQTYFLCNFYGRFSTLYILFWKNKKRKSKFGPPMTSQNSPWTLQTCFASRMLRYFSKSTYAGLVCTNLIRGCRWIFPLNWSEEKVTKQVISLLHSSRSFDFARRLAFFATRFSPG